MPTSAPLPYDPAALAAFQRAGAAILAQERGLTPACRMRLAEAARTAGLAEDQIDDAIRTLGQAEPAAPPSADEERFRQRLRKDLSANTRAIIGPTAEAKILANANRKFALDQPRAEQILREVAAELGLTRITASDAIESLAAQIDHAVGQSTWLAREGWDRLRTAGAKWGLDLEVVDEMIDERLAANKTDDARRSYWTRATLVGTGGAVLATAVIVAGVFMARAMRDDASSSRSDGSTTTHGIESPPSAPRFWDVDLSVDIASARSRHKAQAKAIAGISVARGTERAAGYERLITAIGDPAAEREFRAAVKPVVAGCLALESDDTAAERLLEALLDLLPAAGTPPPSDAKSLDVGLWAADALGEAVLRSGIAWERKNRISGALSSIVGAPSDFADLGLKQRQQALRQRTLLAAYQQLAAAAGKQPAEVAAIYPALHQRAAAALDEEQLLEAETNFLAAALPHAGGAWRTYDRAIGRCVSSPDQLHALRLVDALRRASEPALVEYLSSLLLVRSGAEPKSSAKKDVILAVRKALGGGSGSLSLADRWLQLAEETDAALARPAPKSQDETIRQALTLAHLTTLAVALAQGEAGMASFDAGIERSPELDGSRPAAREAASAETSAAGEPLTRSQQRELSKILEQLSQRGASGLREREAGWRRLAALAKEIDDIPPGAAAQVANYATAKIDAAERGVALAAIAQAGRWKRLRLALADALAADRLPLENQRELVEAVTGRSGASMATTDELRRVLLTSVLDELPGESGSPGGDKLEQLAVALAGTYRERAALAGVNPGELSAAKTPAGLLELLAIKLSQGAGERVSGEQLQQRLTAARYVAGGDLRYTVALQRLLIELSSEQIAAWRPERAAAARRVAAEAIVAAAGLPDAIAQLHAHERALLELWMLYAPET